MVADLGGIALGLGGILTVAGMLLSIMVEQTILGVVIFGIGLMAMIVGVVSGIFYLQQVRKSQASQAETDEISRISSTYQMFYGSPLRDIASLQASKKMIEEDHAIANRLPSNIAEEQERIDRLERTITDFLSRFGKEGQDIEKWKNDGSDQNAQTRINRYCKITRKRVGDFICSN